MNLLQEMFSANEAKIVKSIPIASLSQPNVRIWRCTTNEKFTVKNAYHLVKEMETMAQPEGSSRSRDSGVWRAIWAMNLPNVAKTLCGDLVTTPYQRRIIYCSERLFQIQIVLFGDWKPKRRIMYYGIVSQQGMFGGRVNFVSKRACYKAQTSFKW